MRIFAALALASFSLVASAADKPLPVIVKNDVVPVEVSNADPIPVSVVPNSAASTQFSLIPKQVSLALAGGDVAPGPSGTRFAISSVTISNPTSGHSTVFVRAIAAAAAADNNCRLVSNQQDSADALEIVAAPNSTTHLAFPQPFITHAVAGTYVCLVVAATPASVGIKWGAVGSSILP